MTVTRITMIRRVVQILKLPKNKKTPPPRKRKSVIPPTSLTYSWDSPQPKPKRDPTFPPLL